MNFGTRLSSARNARGQAGLVAARVPRSALKTAVLLALLVALGVAVQTWAALHWSANFNSDEAIYALMARHTLEGRIPTYMYGQRYIGSGEVLLSAAIMRLFGTDLIVFRMGGVLLFGLFFALNALLVWRLWGSRAAGFALLILALPGVYVLENLYRPYSGFGLLLVCGTAAFLLYAIETRGRWAHVARMGAIGFLAGLGLWSHPFTLVYLVALAGAFFLASPEWKELSRRLARFCDCALGVSSRAVLSIVGVGLLGLTVLALFTDGCRPQAQFAGLARAARLLLLLAGILPISLAAVVSERRRHLLLSGATLTAGFVVGNLPQWRAAISFDAPPDTGALPACPSGLISRLDLIVSELVPVMWGAVPLDTLFSSSPGPLLIVSAAVALAAGVAAFATFTWNHRATVLRLASLSPLSQPEQKTAIVLLLFALPLFLALFGGNVRTANQVRYLLISWQASAIVTGIFLARLSTRFFRATLLLVLLWVGVVGVRNLADLDRTWKAQEHRFAPSTVNALHSFLLERGVRGAYADYWDTYSLAFLTGEEIAFAPYNGMDRYHPYMVTVQSLPVRAFVFRPGLLSPGATSTRDLVEFLNVLQPFTGRGHRHIVRELQHQVVLERVALDRWDVWLVTNERQ